MRISVSGGDIPAPIPTFEAMPFRSDQLSLKKTVLHNIENFGSEAGLLRRRIQGADSHPDAVDSRGDPGSRPSRHRSHGFWQDSRVPGSVDPAPGPPRLRRCFSGLSSVAHPLGDPHAHAGAGRAGAPPSAASQPGQRTQVAGPLEGRRCSPHSPQSTMHLFSRKHHTVDCLVSTPLRLIGAIDSGAIELSQAEILVLDEGDKLFEDGFIEQVAPRPLAQLQIDEIMAACSNPRLQRLLFSATLPQGVEAIARTVLRDPIRVLIGQRNTTNSDVEQKLVYCGRRDGGK